MLMKLLQVDTIAGNSMGALAARRRRIHAGNAPDKVAHHQVTEIHETDLNIFLTTRLTKPLLFWPVFVSRIHLHLMHNAPSLASLVVIINSKGECDASFCVLIE